MGQETDGTAAALQGIVDTMATSVALTVIADVALERIRQITVKGYTPEHDDGHELWAMSTAGACYALNAAGLRSSLSEWDIWTFSRDDFKPKSPRYDLVRAAELIIAEIEKLDRRVAVGEKEL